VLRGKARRVWILDADLAAAFDRISHSFLLDALGTFPGKGMIAGWLKAGVFEAGKGFAPTEEGTPQGGIISPLLLNVALHGLEEAAGVRCKSGKEPDKVRDDSPVLTRYADDFVICCHSRKEAENIREKLAGWLAGRGLALNEEKTRVVHLSEGFDFPGWNFRRYPGPKLLIMPSKASVRKHRERLAEEMRTLRGSNALAVIARLNPIIRGWTSYHQGMASSDAFKSLSNYLWQLTWKWARFTSPGGKPAKWVKDKYYGQSRKGSKDRWVFSDKGTGACLLKHAWTRIRRHVLVRGRASPDDPDLAGYWDYRRKKGPFALDGPTVGLLTRQDGRCPLCGNRLLDERRLPSSPEEWEDWWTSVTRQDIPAALITAEPGPPEAGRTARALIHAACKPRRQDKAAPQSAATRLHPVTP
jgi:RNA-directed DNA polymerase